MITEDIFKILNQDCSFYLNYIRICKKGHFLLRGFNYEILDIKKFEHNLESRKPRNMPQNIHDKINNHFLEKLGWKIRNGVFAYGFDMTSRIPKNLGYGPFSLFFPIGEFKFAYHQQHFDLFGVINQLKTDLNIFIENLEFEHDNFCCVMDTNEDYDHFGNEVSICAKAYYLVNVQFAEELTKRIWP